MSYTIEDLTTIDDAVFDALWDASFPRIESGATMLWRKYDAKPLTSDEKKGRMFNASVFDGVAVCHYTLYGPDADGSRSWLYDGEVLRQTRDQLTSDFDVTGHTIHVATGSPMHTYYLSRGNEREHSVSETQGNDGISIITFTYTGE